MKPTEVRALSVDELKLKEMDLRKELFNLKFQLAKGELENNMRVRAVRKDISKVLTIISEKEDKRGIKNA
ncbi:MAG TPA: 50S ribosomal protein L29 [Nitrospinae bacterium]|nr:50S ribosomal protein L29 [Nitrospinota bacterium]